MIISLIVATGINRGIGANNRLPWHLPADLRRFRELTMGHHLIVGRKTFESIGKPLSGRQMIIVTRDRDLSVEGCLVAGSIDEALELARIRGESEVFIGGGAEIYRQTIDRADRIYLTLVETESAADTFFPELKIEDWVELKSEHHPIDEKNPFAYTFKLLARVK